MYPMADCFMKNDGDDCIQHTNLNPKRDGHCEQFGARGLCSCEQEDPPGPPPSGGAGSGAGDPSDPADP
jgi:hypothetical protein